MKQVARFFTVLLLFSTLSSYLQSQVTTPADITIDRDGVILRGKFYVAGGSGFLPTVLLFQGFPGNQTDVIGLGKMLSQSGINVMTFNYSGTHQSQGLLSFENSQLDIQAAFEFLHNPENITWFRIDTSCIILGGYSFGGGMAMTYAIRHPEITSVITIAGNDWGAFFEEYIRNPDLKMTTDANIEKAIASSIARFVEDAMPKEIIEAGLDKMDPDYFLRKNAPRLATRNILIICGWDDDTTYDFIIPLYRALRKENAQNVQINVFQDDHSFLNTRTELVAVIVEWMNGKCH